jgi:glycosyltransferase involved in cell wall biosynthesis
VVFAGDVIHPEGGTASVFDGNVRLLGRLSQAELGGWLERARLYVSPARYDPFGLLPLQAALAGCALLLSDIRSYRELWDGVAAFFDAGDAAGFRRRWSELLEDDETCLAMARRARARALERFGARRMANEYLRLYESLVAPRQPRREAAVLS